MEILPASPNTVSPSAFPLYLSLFPLFDHVILSLPVPCPLTIPPLPLAEINGVLNVPVDETLDDGHLSLAELLVGVTAGSVGEEDGVANLDVVSQGDILDLNIGSVPSVEEEDTGLVGGENVCVTC